MAGAYEGIGIEEATYFGIVISALEIVEPRLGVVVLAARAKRRPFSASPEAMESEDSMAELYFVDYTYLVNIAQTNIVVQRAKRTSMPRSMIIIIF